MDTNFELVSITKNEELVTELHSARAFSSTSLPSFSCYNLMFDLKWQEVTAPSILNTAEEETMGASRRSRWSWSSCSQIQSKGYIHQSLLSLTCHLFFFILFRDLCPLHLSHPLYTRLIYIEMTGISVGQGILFQH